MNGAKGETVRERIEAKRKRHRVLTRFCSELMKWQHAKGRFFLCENPRSSQAWKLPEFAWLFQETDIFTWTTDMCQYNLRDPKSQLFYRKATRLVSNVASVRDMLSDRCSGQVFPHDHQVIEGATLRDGQSIRRSEYAGWYTHEFCIRLLTGFETHLNWEVPVLKRSDGSTKCGMGDAYIRC